MYAACLVLVGCGGSGGQRAAAPLAPPRVDSGTLDAKVLLQDLPAKASKLGAGPLSIVASGEASEGERLGAFVRIPDNTCLLAYARASSSLEDIDVAAFAEEGNPIASDEGPDAHPAVVVCPEHAARVYLVVHAASGEGLVVLAAQEVPRERAADVARALGARGGAGQGPRPADAWPGLEDHVRIHRATIGGRWEETRRVAVTLDSRSPTAIGFSLKANECIDAVVVPDEDVALVELEAEDADGRLVARSRDAGRDRALKLCSPLAIDGRLVMRPHVGNGLAAVVLAHAPMDRLRDAGSKAQLAWVSARGPLEANRSARDTDLVKTGYAAAAAKKNGILVLGRRSTIPLDFSAPKGAKAAPVCSRVDVVGGEPLALVDAEIWDDQGALVSRAYGASSATLFSCARAKLDLELEARGRPGPFAVMARPERWDDAAFAAHPLASARMLTASTTGIAAHIEGTPLPVRSFVVDATHRAVFEEKLRGGACLDVAAGGEGAGGGLELRAFDAGTQEELDRDSGSLSAEVHACTAENQPKTLRIEVRGVGKLDVVVGERTR
ncbi:MAG: hypothetical protein ABI551_22235 [Polyangiaceae bacterium]